MSRPFPARRLRAYTLLTRLTALRDRLAGRPGRSPVSRPAKLALEAMEDRIVLDGRPLPYPTIFAGSGVGIAPEVKGYAADTGGLLWSAPVFEPGFVGGVRVAAGDVTGDGFPDAIAAAGRGHAPTITVLDGKTGAVIPGPLGNFSAFGPLARGGVFVASADVDGDGRADVVVGAVTAAGTAVRAFSGTTGGQIAQFVVTGPAFAAGLTLAAADLTGDGRAEVVVGSRTTAKVRTYDPLTGTVIGGPLGSFEAFGPGYAAGVHVGADALAGDVTGDGVADLAIGTGVGTPARVAVFDGATGGLVRTITPFGGFAGGARTALAYVTDDAFADVVVGTGPGAATVQVFDGTTGRPLPAPSGRYDPFPGSTGGVAVAASNDPPTIPPSPPPSPPTPGMRDPFMSPVLVDGPDVTFSPDDSFFSVPAGSDFALTVTIEHQWIDGVDYYPGGTVTFSAALWGGATYTYSAADLEWDGSAPLTTASILVTSTLPAGEYLITGTYSGDAHFFPWATYALLRVTAAPGPEVPDELAPAGDCPVDPVAEGAGGGAATRGGLTVGGVGADGSVAAARADLGAGGSGLPFGQDWAWTNARGYADGVSGRGATGSRLPRLVQVDSDTLALITGPRAARFFDAQPGGQYSVRYGSTVGLHYDTPTGRYVVADGAGNTFTFYDFSAGVPAGRAGKLVSMTDAAGNGVAVTAWDTAGRPTAVVQTTGGVTESFAYAYVGSGVNAGLLASVTQSRQVGGGAFVAVRTAEYGYYDGSAGPGLAGNLRTAVVRDGDATGPVLDTTYYRWYTAGAGQEGNLKYAFGPAAYARLTAALGTSVDSLTDAQVDDYADTFLDYDTAGRVVTLVSAGAGCSVCSGGQGTYTYAYTAGPGGLGDTNAWATKVVETLPDGSTRTAYANALGQPLVVAFDDVGTTGEWVTYTRYDAAGRVILQAAPSAVTGYSEGYADLVNYSGGNAQYLSDSTGLVTTWTYAGTTTATTSAAGDAAGHLKAVTILHGETGIVGAGTASPQAAFTYIQQTAGGQDFFHVASDTVYRNDDGTGGQTTTYSYTFTTGTNHVESVTTTLPAVTTGQNGSNAATSGTTVFDSYGRATWVKDPGGYLTYVAYDDATGAVVKLITDVDTTQTATFAGLPGGWSTPAGGGLHLTTAYEVDSLGRVTKETTPEGRVNYTVYRDSLHEIRYYPGWDSLASTTGPTMVVREDRANGYTETLTMSAQPGTSSLRPTGTEPIDGVQSLARNHVNAAGQVTQTDAYFNLSGLTYSAAAALGTEGTHFYRTRYTYNHLGLLNKTTSPEGTIYRTVYDGQGRPVSEWVGTDDTPTSGFWSPANLTGTDTMKVRGYEYDGGGVGNGNLTKVTEIPGGTTADRVTQVWYDWRDRAVAVKAGVEGSEATNVNRPLAYSDYDNLGNVTQVRTYDADGVVPTITGEVPQPLSSSLLRAQTTAEYDELGRAFRTRQFSVNPVTGAVSTNSLATDVWYDARGLVVKQSNPNGLVAKYAYDGAGRVTRATLGDWGNDSGYADADDVTGDAVVEQSETTYDKDGLPLATVTRQRFHDATGTGALGSPSSGIGARVSYAGYYYDQAGRLTAAVDVGTNGGTAWTRPSTVPARSDTALVASYAYDAAGNVSEVTDPKGLVTRTEYDALGRPTKTVENYVNGAVSDADDKTTTYTYNSVGMTSLTAHLTGGGVQTTEWVYGVTAGTGSTITSNDVVGKTRWPDATTGAASSSEQETVTVNALGQTLTATDRNGTTHALTYDALGRVVADAVIAFGAGVDQAVVRVEYGYDTLGNVALVTSRNASNAVVNQVAREFNGLGQMTVDWQSHAGAVTGSTPKVQYAYNFNGSGTVNQSRLTTVTYASGYQLNYNYASGLSTAISRLSALSDSTGQIESYDYLGLATVVRRGRLQPGVDLTYVKQAGESNGDAGDQYTGLDRFGRVVDQRWLKTSTGAATDRFQYGYDRDSNRLWRDNLVNAVFGELYAYDGLGQLTGFDRGTLNGTKTGLTGSASRTQDWDYDALGNWDSLTTDGGSPQTRTHNKQNEITGVSGATTPTFDANGNMTGDETGKQFVYDAWNRLVAVKDSGGTTLKTYAYDGLGRRVSETAGGTTTDLYYSAQWQVLEEKVGSSTTKRYVWSPVYVDAMVLRDRDTDGNGTLDERLWVQQDANFNVTALVDGSGSVVERYAYDPYGAVTVYDANYGVRSGGSNYGSTVLWQGMVYDPISGSYKSRYRTDISPTLGRPFQVDPLRFGAGDVNFYRWEGNNPTVVLDPSGLSWLSRRWDDAGMIATWAGRGLNPWAEDYSKPLPTKAADGNNLPSGLTAGSTISRENKQWGRDTMSSAAPLMATGALAVVSIVIPGPEEAVLAWSATKGFKAIKGAAGRWSFTKRNGAKLSECDAKAVEAYAQNWATRPPNMSPAGVGRQGVFNAVKRANGIPTSMQPTRIRRNVDLRGNPQPGYIYEYDLPAPGGGTRTVRIRDDAGGHNYGPGNPQNRGPHFNDDAGNHYDY